MYSSTKFGSTMKSITFNTWGPEQIKDETSDARHPGLIYSLDIAVFLFQMEMNEVLNGYKHECGIKG